MSGGKPTLGRRLRRDAAARETVLPQVRAQTRVTQRSRAGDRMPGRPSSEPCMVLPVCGGAAGSCTVTQSPPAARGVRVRVPSCAWVMLLTIARPRPTPAWSARTRLLPRRNGSTSCGHQLWGELLAGVLDGEHHTLGVNGGRDPHGALFRQVVDDRVVHEVRSQLQQERL